MNTKSLLILVVLVVVGVAAYLFSQGDSRINSAEKVGSPILPGLYVALNDVDTLQFTTASDEAVTTLQRQDDKWVVAERNNYSADIAKIRSIVLSLAEAKILEQKTSNPELYSKLGVESIEQNSAQGTQVSIRYGNQNSALIVGKPGPQINKSRYVRRADETTSWLVDRKLDVQYEIAHWLRKDLLSVEPADVAAVSIVLADNSRLEIENDNSEENKFFVTNLSDPDSQVIDAELHQVTNALSSFQLLDVKTQAEFGSFEPTMMIEYQLKSGANINMVAYEVSGEHFVSIDASVRESSNDEVSSSKDMQTFVQEIQNKTKNWIFKIPNVSYDSMYKSEQDVLAITEDQLN